MKEHRVHQNGCKFSIIRSSFVMDEHERVEKCYEKRPHRPESAVFLSTFNIQAIARDIQPKNHQWPKSDKKINFEQANTVLDCSSLGLQ